MKKIISSLLCLIMLMTLFVPAAYAVDEKPYEPGATPIIYLRGNGEAIYYEDGTIAPIDLPEVLGDSSIYDTDGMVKEIVNIMIPFVTRGLAKDDWDECRKAIYNAISPFFIQAISDGDGNAQLGTTISKAAQESNENPNPVAKDHYSVDELTFFYDWRRDPYDNVDALHDYVLKILDKTGKKQVSFTSRCLGGTLLNAYLEKYGHLGLVKNAMYGDTLAMSSTVLSKLFSGKLSVDGKNVQRYKGQLEHCAAVGQGVGFALPQLVDDILLPTLDLLTQTGSMDAIGDGIETLYDDLLHLLLPALLHAVGYGSMPNYWACVAEEDFDEALEFMFGEDGSEARVHFDGMIKKINYYREHVTSKQPKLYSKFINEYKINIGTVSKYGYLNMPMIEDNEILSDSLASLTHASFGAYCANVGETLPEDYVAARVGEGKGKYISPDKQVDISTAISPNTSWVVKNCHHGFADIVFKIAEEFCNGTDMTVEKSSYPQFIMYEETTGKWSEMTEDNCGDLEFMTRAEKEPTVATTLASGLRFLTAIIVFITMLFKGEISFDSLGSLFGK